MRTRFTIFFFFFVAIFMAATGNAPFWSVLSERVSANAGSSDSDSTGLGILSDSIGSDSLSFDDSLTYDYDSLGNIIGMPTGILALDTLDSLHRAIYLHNKAVDDSIAKDSIYRMRKSGIEAPVKYVASDSIVYFASSKNAYLYGSSNVKYQDMDLTSDKVTMNLDSSLVHATGSYDTSKAELYGTPVFVMGSDTYENDTMSFNFKSKRGLIKNVYTEQEDGFMTAELSKRDQEGNLYLYHGRYTTCDDPHPDFYIAMSRMKVRPGKDAIFGPAYLVVQDVPLPLAIPYGFFPFSKSYSSGFIMPTYGDENTRGFYLRDGGYYFAISDKMDLKLLGEIYTKGSWGVSAASNYRKRYKFSGSFYFNYQDTRTGDKGMPDYTKQTSFKIQWTHRQDAKANPFNTLSASINFATSSFENNNLTSLYNPVSRAQSTRTSSVSWSTNFSSIGMSLSSTFNVAQNMRDSSLALTLPDLNISIARFYPFKRKHAAGKERWYEKLSMSYTGRFSNSINAKEDQVLKSSFTKDWRNGLQHNIPISGSFTLFKYINVNPSFNLTDRMYTSRTERHWDEVQNREVRDTIYGFNNVYNWNLSLSASTKMYGFFVPNRKIFGDKIDRIRHVMTPTLSFSYAPDFSSQSYGFYGTYLKTDAQGNVSEVKYSKYDGALYGGAPSGKMGSFNMSLSNNVEMKVKSDKDSTGFKKISLIDELGASMSYNMAAKTRPLSDLTVNMRLKWWKNYTFSTTAVFATYAYQLDDNGRPFISDRTEYSFGRFGRYQGMSQNISYTLTPDKIKKWFSGKSDKDSKNGKDSDNDDDDDDTGVETNIDPTMQKAQNGAKNEKSSMADTDEDGYMRFSMPWSLTFSYGVTMREDRSGKFNTKTMRYPYGFSQNLNFSGNIRLSEGWNISFSSGYDFNFHKLSMTTASLARDLHCFSMSCSVVLAPYTSYNFSFRCNAATLTDALKYDKRSSYSNNIKWY